MKALKGKGTRIAASLALVGLLASAATAQETPFPLTKAVPEDVFLITAERPNPERDFLDAYWMDVWDALLESGVRDDAIELVLGLAPEDDRDDVTRVLDRFRGLVSEVDWKVLGEGEVVFAERLPVPIFVEPGTLIGQPDMVLLFRPGRAAAAETFARFHAILTAIADEVHALSRQAFEVAELDMYGTRLAGLDLLQLLENAPSLPLSVGLREDVVFVTYGPGMREQVSELLAGQGKSIAANPRFVKALEALPHTPETLEFVDFHHLRVGIERFAGRILAKAEGEIEVKERVLGAVREGEVFELTQRSLVSYRAGRHDEALEIAHQAHLRDRTDTLSLYNIACLHALKGETDTALDWLAMAVDGGFHAPTKIVQDPDLGSLHDEPRFAAIVGRAMVAARADSLAPLTVARTLVDRALVPLDMLEASATVRQTADHATWSDTLTTLAPDAAKNPFYGIVADRPGMTDFLRYLPQETTSFCVSSGIEWTDLYGFLEDSVAQAGELGQRGLFAWTELQQSLGFDLCEELGWIDGATVRTSFRILGEDAWVWRMKVRDEERVRESVDLFVERFPVLMGELVERKPMLAMLNPRTSPTAHEELSGFHDIAFGMMVTPFVCGVHEGWFVLGSSAEAVATAERSAAGEHPNVARNSELMRKALLPDEPLCSASFSDHRGTADEVAAIVAGVSSFGGMAVAQVPEPEAREALTRIFGMIAKLPPVIATIDFYEFSAQATTFDGKAWHKRAVTYFVPPERHGHRSSVER